MPGRGAETGVLERRPSSGDQTGHGRVGCRALKRTRLPEERWVPAANAAAACSLAARAPGLRIGSKEVPMILENLAPRRGDTLANATSSALGCSAWRSMTLRLPEIVNEHPLWLRNLEEVVWQIVEPDLLYGVGDDSHDLSAVGLGGRVRVVRDAYLSLR
jgi:hypothetical protein